MLIFCFIIVYCLLFLNLNFIQMIIKMTKDKKILKLYSRSDLSAYGDLDILT